MKSEERGPEVALLFTFGADFTGRGAPKIVAPVLSLILGTPSNPVGCARRDLKRFP